MTCEALGPLPARRSLNESTQFKAQLLKSAFISLCLQSDVGHGMPVAHRPLPSMRHLSDSRYRPEYDAGSSSEMVRDLIFW